MGYKGSPDDRGRVEIGYGIDPEAGGRGYTTEAAAALTEWAFQHPDCKEILAPETRKDNPASHRVLVKLGMQAYSETDDAISYHLLRGSSDSN
jgi:RimJ/RimL family protein N-acetyltransferase